MKGKPTSAKKLRKDSSKARVLWQAGIRKCTCSIDGGGQYHTHTLKYLKLGRK